MKQQQQKEKQIYKYRHNLMVAREGMGEIGETSSYKMDKSQG